MVQPEVQAVGETRDPRIGRWSFVLWTLWFGCLAGASELAVFVLKCRYLDPRNYNVSRHFLWMYPVAGLLIVGGAGLSLLLVTRLARLRVNAEPVLFVLTFLATAGVLFRLPIYTAAALLVAAALALRTARWLAPRARSFNQIVQLSLPVFAALLAATIAFSFVPGGMVEPGQCHSRSERPHPAPNVLLIVLDTFRGDLISPAGAEAGRTPNLGRLAARGVRFSRALATAPWTAPSHASMFTGRWAHELSVGWDRPLDATHPTLAAFLAARGYSTAGFVANTTYCSYETGLDRGFAHYEDYDLTFRSIVLCSTLVQRTVNFLDKHPELCIRILGLKQAGGHGYRKSAARINHNFLAWLDGLRQRDPSRPYFAFLNYYDAHHPYLPPDETRETTSDVRLLKGWWDVDKHDLSPKDAARARAAYDRCVAYLDRQFGILVDELKLRGELENTLVVVTADHGEHFGEQGLYGHGASVYLPEIHVPLLILSPLTGPDRTGQVVKRPVSLRDLAATIVSELGAEVARDAPFPGRSLFAAADDERDGKNSSLVLSEIADPPEADPNQGRSPVCRGPLRSVVEGSLHYIRNGDGREELYHVDDDPGETTNLACRPDLALSLARLRGRLPSSAKSTELVPGPLIVAGRHSAGVVPRAGKPATSGP